MKTTYLANQAQPDGCTALTVISSAEWVSIVKKNKQLPSEQQRHFIIDYIVDGTEIDRMVIEAPAEMYYTWLREHVAAQRNRRRGKEYRLLSIDAVIQQEDDTVLIGESIASDIQVEATACDRLLMENLREALRSWKPWANDILDRYLKGEKRSCTSALAKKYGVSQQVIRKYKRQFEEFIKNFLTGVSF